MSEQTKSPLLALPPELRIAIYGEVFEGCVRDLELDWIELPKLVALLFTCKQIYNEAIEIYYSKVRVESQHFSEIIRYANNFSGPHYGLIPELRLVQTIPQVQLAGCLIDAMAEQDHKRLIRHIKRSRMDVKGNKVSVEVKVGKDLSRE